MRWRDGLVAALAHTLHAVQWLARGGHVLTWRTRAVRKLCILTCRGLLVVVVVSNRDCVAWQCANAQFVLLPNVVHPRGEDEGARAHPHHPLLREPVLYTS